MYKNLLVLPDGTEIFSGSGVKNAIKNIKSTQMVNSGEELTIGSACSDMIEATLFTPRGDLNITAGDELIHYKVDATGNRTKVGLFTVEQPTRPTPNAMKIVGYDRMAKLDKDLTAWLESLTGWPYSVNTFATMACEACGVTFVEQTGLPNADFPIRKWKKSGATGRQILRWLGEIMCRDVYADPEGNIRFGWYADSGKSYAAAGENYFFAGSLTYENYQVAPVEAVQLRLADSDSGAPWPQVDEGTNSYIITGNPILTAYVTEDLLPYLDVIADELAQVTYTPCEVAVQATLDVKVGDIIHITDKNGKTLSTYVMSQITSGQRATLSCTGSQRRDSSSATYNKTESEKRAEADNAAEAVAKKAVDAQTQQDIFNKLTNYRKAQGVFLQDGELYINASYMMSGVLDAALVTVTNLIAETLVSKNNFGTTMEVRGGIFRLLQDSKTLFNLTTEYTGASLMRLTSTEASARPSNLEISPWGLQALDLSGIIPVDKLFIGVDVSTGLPVLSCNGVKKAISWRQNSDGTYTLVGK